DVGDPKVEDESFVTRRIEEEVARETEAGGTIAHAAVGGDGDHLAALERADAAHQQVPRAVRGGAEATLEAAREGAEGRTIDLVLEDLSGGREVGVEDRIHDPQRSVPSERDSAHEVEPADEVGRRPRH